MTDTPRGSAASDVPDLGKPFCTRCHKWGHRYTECPEPAEVADPTDIAAFGCRCSFVGGCAERATQEDMLCDTCRRGPALHMHVGDMEGGAMHPIATTGPPVFK